MTTEVPSVSGAHQDAPPASGGDCLGRRLTVLFWVLAAALGAFEAWDGRFDMNPDGVAYLGIADAYLSHGWRGAINTNWPPLYSWLLAGAMVVLRPTPYWEFPVVHAVNFLIYLCALACLHVLLRELICYHRDRPSAARGSDETALPVWAWLVLGYSLFLWSTLRLTTVTVVAPDMCVTAVIYLASAALLRVCRGAAGWLTFGLLGTVLGIGYLAKTYMFPVAFVFLMVALLCAGKLKWAIPRVLVAFAFFALVSAPLIAALSTTKGRLTYGENGVLNYAFHVNGVPYIHWQGEPRGTGTPKHPTRKIFDTPDAYEFGTPKQATYSPWQDQAYWNDGVVPRFHLSGHFRQLSRNVKAIGNVFLRSGGGVLVCWLALHLLGALGRRPVWRISAQWAIVAPALTALALFSLIYVEVRHLGPFVVPIWLGLYSSVRLPRSDEMRRGLACIVLSVGLVTMVQVGAPPALRGAQALPCALRGGNPRPHVQWHVAQELHRLGVQEGDKVAAIGHSLCAFWARLARLRIVAEIPLGSVPDFWAAAPSVKVDVVKAFAGTGAKAIVAHQIPRSNSIGDWRRIGNTDHYVLLLDETAR